MKPIKRIAFTLTLFITAGTIACGNRTQDAGENSSKAAVDIADAYTSDTFIFENIPAVFAAASKDNIVYFYSYEYPPGFKIGDEFDYGEAKPAIYYLDIDSDDPKMTKMPFDIALTGSVSSMAVNDDLSIDLAVSDFDYSGIDFDDAEAVASAPGDIYVIRLDKDGNEISRIMVTDDLRDTDYMYPQNLTTDADGRIYLTNTNTVYSWDKQGKLLFKIPVNTYTLQLSRNRSGDKIYCSWVANGTIQTQVAVIDPVSGTLGQSHDLAGNSALGLAPGLSGDLLFASQTGAYDYDIDNRRYDEVFDWIDVDIAVDWSGTLLSLSGGRIGWFDNTYPDGGARLNIIRPYRDDEARPETETFLLGGIELYLTFFDQAVMDFNLSQSKYRIEIKKYGTDGDIEAGINQLNLDIVNGKGPDIIMLPARFSMDIFAQKGVLTDLYPFIESDSEIELKDLQENVIKAHDSGGQLFGLPLSFDIRTVIAAKSELSDISGWNLDEMIDYASSRMPENTVFEDHSKSGVFSLCLFANGDALVDWMGEESSIKRDLLLKMLHFADQFTPDHLYSYDGNLMGRIQNDEQVKLLPMNVSDYTSHQFNMTIFGKQVTYPGYPADDGYGNIIRSATVMAINSGCRDKEAAWEFIRSMLSVEFQTSHAIINFPILKSAQEIKINKAMEVVYYDDNGIKREEPVSTFSWSGSDDLIEVYASTENDIQTIRDLINSANKIRIFDRQINDIVMEEAQSFFSGNKSAEEVVDIIENRIRIYVNELK